LSFPSDNKGPPHIDRGKAVPPLSEPHLRMDQTCRLVKLGGEVIEPAHHKMRKEVERFFHKKDTFERRKSRKPHNFAFKKMPQEDQEGQYLWG
jgi:hypothetical protein